jgi:hypothetical protein
MIESHYGAHVVDAMDDLAAKAIIPLTTASAEVIDLPRQCAVAGGAAFGLMGRQRATAAGSPRRNRMIAILLRLAAARARQAAATGGARSSRRRRGRQWEWRAGRLAFIGLKID